MKKLSLKQTETLELLTQFKGTLNEKILRLFRKRDISSLEKRGYLSKVPLSSRFFVSERGIKCLARILAEQKNGSGAKEKLELEFRDFYLLENFQKSATQMAKITIKCPKCNKIAEVIKSVEIFSKLIKTYSCGHIVSQNLIHVAEKPSSSNDSLEGRDEIWEKLREYQREGVEFLERSNFQAILGDAPGLGKTPQTLVALRYHFDELTPTLCVVKSSLKYQWATHYVDWTLKDPSRLELMPYIITDGGMPVLPGFKFYIIGMDLLKKKWESFVPLGIKLIILDESHNFKNDSTSRTAALNALVREAKIPYVICTSGTPIVNRSSEFFTTLNLVRPDEWYSKMSFLRNWHETNDKGQYTRILSYRVDEFKNKIKPYFLRREKREVLHDLPPFQRNFRIVDVDDPNIKRLYNKELDLMANWMNSEKHETENKSLSLLAYLNKLRRIVGLAKVPACIDDTLEFLDFADAETGDKIAIGVHHKAVAQALKLAFEQRGFNVITLSGEDSPEMKSEKIEQFKCPNNHILIASTLAAGEGLNLQFCSIASLLERQWNAAKEEQFESRFDRFGQTRPTSCDYFVAKGTVDEFFSKMVEEKRKDCAETLGDELNIETNINLLQELAEITVRNRL